MSAYPRTARCSSFITSLVATACLAPLAFAQATSPAINRPTAPVDGWTSAVDAGDAKAKPRLDLRLTLPIKHQTRCVLPDRPSPFVAICDANAFGPKQWSLLNLNTGAITPAFAAKMNLDDPSLSPDAQYLATKARGEKGQPSACEIYAVKGGKQLYRLTSGDDHWPPVPIGFTLPDQLVSFTNVKFKPALQAWDLKTGNKLWETPLDKGIEPRTAAVSPGGKFVAFIAERKLTILDAATGQPLDSVDLPQGEERNPKPRGLAFSPDGLELAAYCEAGHAKSRLLIWDLATGVVMTDQTAEAPKDDRWARGDNRKFEYFADPRLLRFSNWVIDRESGKAIYAIPPSKQGRPDDLMMALGNDRVLLVSEKEQDKAFVTVAALPKAELDKSLAVVRTGGRSTDANLPRNPSPITPPYASRLMPPVRPPGPTNRTRAPSPPPRQAAQSRSAHSKVRAATTGSNTSATPRPGRTNSPSRTTSRSRTTAARRPSSTASPCRPARRPARSNSPNTSRSPTAPPTAN
jgi:hypothetical protein